MVKRTKGKLLKIWLVTGCVILSLVGCGYGEQQVPDDSGEKTGKTTVEIAETQDINQVGMIEDTSVYDNDDPTSIVYFYVTVQKGDAGSETDHTFQEVNNVVRFLNSTHVVNDVYARAIVQVGDETGPLPGMLGHGVEKSNARIRIRGNSSSVKEQKSYKLALDDEAGLWRGQSNIALNKSIFDTTRMKNKLYFDMLREIPNVPSMRTQFARLFIKDETSGQTEFHDYGLFTQTEVPTKKYLGNHGLDTEGYLYKAISFNFEPSMGLKNFDDPEFSQEALDQVISCRGRQDNQKLIELVEMINDKSIDINETIGTYIDRDNYITWLAYNILVANIDTTVQNFYLYSPLNSQKWFFLPWDGDNMLHVQEDIMEGLDVAYGGWEHGISNYWGVILHQRFLKNESNRQELAEKVDELHEMVNKGSVDALVESYNKTVEPFATAMPDFYYLGHTAEERNQLLSGLGDEVEFAYKQFQDSLYELMPFFLYAVEQESDKVRISWEEAYDFYNESITYHLTVAATPDFANPVIDKEGIAELFYEMNKQILPPGIWYWKVTAKTTSGKTAEAMNKIQVNDVFYPGVEVMEVLP